MKVFKMNDYDWVAAENLEDAMQCLADTVGDGVVNDQFKEEFIDEPYELDQAEMEKMMFVHEDNDGPKVPFKDELARLVENGSKFPRFFASTEY